MVAVKASAEKEEATVAGKASAVKEAMVVV